MRGWLSGFADELVKLAETNPSEMRAVLREAKQEAQEAPRDAESIRSIRGKGAPVSRDYLASMLIGGLATPLLTVAGKRISRTIHNRAVEKALKGTLRPGKRKALQAELQTGPLVGRPRPDLPLGKRPQVTPADILSDAAKGVIGGSLVQMIRDRYSGSGKA